MTHPDPKIAAALAYAARGWYVFPLAPGSKIPHPGSRGHHDASTSAEAILAWPAGSNIGIDLERSGLIVLDVDVSAGKNGAEALRDVDPELVPTLTQRTGRGGLQAFHERGGAHAGRKVSIPTERFPGHDKEHRSDASGLDLFGKGYVLLPPSVLEGEAFAGAAPGADGTYRWIRDLPPAPLPPFLAAHAEKKAPAPATSDTSPRGPATPEILRAAARRLERHGPAISGQGGNAHTRAAWGLLVHDYALSEGEAFPLFLVWNLTCDPPWDPSEARRGPARSGQNFDGPYGALRDIVEGASAIDDVLEGLEDGAGPFGGLDDLGPELSPWEEALARARAEILAALGSEEHRGTPEPLFESAITLLGKKFPRTPWLVRGLMIEGGVIILGGAPKTGKSWMLTDLGIAVASGTPALGRFATGAPKTVAYFYAEDIAQSVQSHIAALCVGRNVDPLDALRGLHVQPRGRFLDVTKDDDCALIIASCRGIGKVDLLCLEPLRDLHSGVENDSDAMAPVMKRLRVIGELIGRSQGSPCTVAVAHHSKKTTDVAVTRAGEGLRGSGAIFGSADAVIELMNPGGNGEDLISAHVKITLRGARAAAPFDLNLKIDDGADGTAVRATYDALDAKASAVKANLEDGDRISLLFTAIGNSPDRCLSKNSLCDLLGGNKQKTGLQIEDLVRRGVIVLTDRHPVHGGPLKPAKYRAGVMPEKTPE
jgi:hypothetical protein